MYAKAMKQPYKAGPAYSPGQSTAVSSANPETAAINEVCLLWAFSSSTQPNEACCLQSVRQRPAHVCRGGGCVSQVEEDVPDYGAAKE